MYFFLTGWLTVLSTFAEKMTLILSCSPMVALKPKQKYAWAFQTIIQSTGNHHGVVSYLFLVWWTRFEFAIDRGDVKFIRRIALHKSIGEVFVSVVAQMFCWRSKCYIIMAMVAINTLISVCTNDWMKVDKKLKKIKTVWGFHLRGCRCLSEAFRELACLSVPAWIKTLFSRCVLVLFLRSYVIYCRVHW